MQTTPAKAGLTTAQRPHFPISLGDLAQALDYSDEGFALTDPDGNYVYINEAHLRMYSYDRPEDLLGRSWRLLYTEEWVRHFEEAVLPIMPRDKVWRGQVVGRRRDGSSFLAGVTLTLLPDGKITCNCRDESVMRVGPDAPATDNGKSLLRQLGERLIAGLPARFRRPLDMVSGYSSFLISELEAGRQPATDSLREGLVEIGSAGRHLSEQMLRLALVAELAARDEFGDAATGDPGKDWSRRLAGACQLRADAAGRTDDLQLKLAPGCPALEYRALECVVLELLSNAMQSSRAGDAVKITGRSHGGQYVLKVCDEGVGLPADGLETFTARPFGQSTPCGFGLAVVQYILRRSGGRIDLDPSNSCATCLRVTVPML